MSTNQTLAELVEEICRRGLGGPEAATYLIEQGVTLAALGSPGVALARLERFIDFAGDEPRYITASGTRRAMPKRFHADALAIRAALSSSGDPPYPTHDARGRRYAASLDVVPGADEATTPPAMPPRSAR